MKLSYRVYISDRGDPFMSDVGALMATT